MRPRPGGVGDRARRFSFALVAYCLTVALPALAILTDEPDLESYYREEVIGGGEAFAMAANGFEDFAEAMRLKLIREIEYRPRVSGLVPSLRGSN